MQIGYGAGSAMILSLAVAAGLADKCAPRVARETLLSVVYHESRLDTLVIADNTTGQRFHLPSRPQAIATAKALIARGHSIDMGIGQINSRTAPDLGLSVPDAFDACRNMAAAATLLERNYRKVGGGGSAQTSLAAMLSMYNTGNAWRGFGNGYVGRVYQAAATIVPQLGRTQRVNIDPASIDPIVGDGPAEAAGTPTAPAAGPRAVDAVVRPIPAPAWVAFGNPTNVMVFETSSAGAGTFDRKEKSQ